MKNEKFQKEIKDWFDLTFSNQDISAKVDALGDEVDELINDPMDKYEIADVYIILMSIANCSGYNIESELLKCEDKNILDGYYVNGILSYIKRNLKLLRLDAENSEYVVNIYIGLNKMCDIYSYNLDEISMQKFNIIKDRIYGQPDDRGVRRHIKKSTLELSHKLLTVGELIDDFIKIPTKEHRGNVNNKNHWKNRIIQVLVDDMAILSPDIEFKIVIPDWQILNTNVEIVASDPRGRCKYKIRLELNLKSWGVFSLYIIDSSKDLGIFKKGSVLDLAGYNYDKTSIQYNMSADDILKMIMSDKKFISYDCA